MNENKTGKKKAVILTVCIVILAAAAFFLVYLAGIGLLKALSPSDGFSSVAAIHVLLAAYLVHLLVRTAYLSVRYRKDILAKPFGNPALQ